MTYHFIFETEAGKKISQTIDANCIEDATIEGSNIAEENKWELLAVDEQ